MEIMKKSGARGRHKWKWHKKTERAVFSLVAIANTKARGETLIEATEWHAQSNWISSAVSSNLIWPALWRMTGERNTFPLPAPPSGCAPHTERPTDVPLPHNNWPTSAVWAATSYCLACSIPRQTRLHSTSTPSVPPPPTHTDHPGFLCLSHTSATLDWDLQTLQGHGGSQGKGGSDEDRVTRTWKRVSFYTKMSHCCYCLLQRKVTSMCIYSKW